MFAWNLQVFALMIGLSSGEYYGKEIGSFPSNAAHDVTGTIYAIDVDTIQIRGFNYDGLGPDAHFWAGKRTEVGPEPDDKGIKIPNEKGSNLKLGGYVNKDLILVLPVNLKDLAWISVWCVKFKANFGHVSIPASFIPPAPMNLGHLNGNTHGVSSGDVTLLDTRRIRIEKLNYDGAGPDAFFLVGMGKTPAKDGTKVPDEDGSTGILHGYTEKTIELTLPEGKSFMELGYFALFCIRYTENFGHVEIPVNLNIPPHLKDYIKPAVSGLDNCVSLNDHFNVAWTVDDPKITIELSGKIEDDEYLTFGISGSTTRSAMVQGDVTVVYYDNGPKAVDYYLQAYAPCSNDQGVCPDTATAGKQDNVELIEGERRDGITRVKFSRPLNTGDSIDKVIDPTQDMYVIWAIGPLRDNKVTKHTTKINGDLKIQFGRSASQSCTTLNEESTDKVKPWIITPIRGDEVTEFTVDIGAAGLNRGYSAITGIQSWGICLYINQLIIPELILVRGIEYTFKVHGGKDSTNTAKYHPFYITDDKTGGYVQKDAAERASVQVFAGVDANGKPTDTSIGNYCEYKPKTTDESAKYPLFKDYFATLEHECTTPDAPGILKWTPDASTPDLVYYQCYTHEHLGWKTHVVDAAEDVQKKFDEILEKMKGASDAEQPTGQLLLIFASLTACLYYI